MQVDPAAIPFDGNSLVRVGALHGLPCRAVPQRDVKTINLLRCRHVCIGRAGVWLAALAALRHDRKIKTSADIRAPIVGGEFMFKASKSRLFAVLASVVLLAAGAASAQDK